MLLSFIVEAGGDGDIGMKTGGHKNTHIIFLNKNTQLHAYLIIIPCTPVVGRGLLLAEGAQLKEIDMDDGFTDTMETCDHGMYNTLSCIHVTGTVCLNYSNMLQLCMHDCACIQTYTSHAVADIAQTQGMGLFF